MLAMPQDLTTRRSCVLRSRSLVLSRPSCFNRVSYGIWGQGRIRPLLIFSPNLYVTSEKWPGTAYDLTTPC